MKKKKKMKRKNFRTRTTAATDEADDGTEERLQQVRELQKVRVLSRQGGVRAETLAATEAEKEGEKESKRAKVEEFDVGLNDGAKGGSDSSAMRMQQYIERMLKEETKDRAGGATGPKKEGAGGQLFETPEHLKAESVATKDAGEKTSSVHFLAGIEEIELPRAKQKNVEETELARKKLESAPPQPTVERDIGQLRHHHRCESVLHIHFPL